MSVNLKTGNRYAPRREDYCTKCAPVAPGGDCLLWLEFLERVTGGDGELIKYLQRVAGYCLTGHVSEHALFFLHGTGNNGKGVFVNTLVGIWGEYAFVAPAEMFIESHNERHPTELASLLGARLVASSETPSGRHWNESRIKMLTGGDHIAARFMRGDYFNFAPQFKLLISGNHKPSLRAVNEAIRRRMHLVPFTVVIPEKERDLNLTTKLRTEWPGILQWAINGCAEWRRIGLCPPKAVVKATESYLQGEDNILTWIEERAVEEPNAEATTSELFASWKDWCEQSGARCGSKKAFSGALTDKGFKSDHSRKGTVFFGIQLGQR
jgi:putative DNA primase/helicase